MGYIDFVQRKCGYCGKLIIKEPLKATIENKELMFCNDACRKKYGEYHKIS